MEPNPHLVFSSVFLAIPGMFYLMKQEYLGMAFSFACSLFSALHHATKPRYPLILAADLFFANSSVALALHAASRGLPISLIPTFMFTIGAYGLYHYGYKNSCFVWDPDLATATRWHTLLHVGNGVLASWLVVLTT